MSHDEVVDSIVDGVATLTLRRPSLNVLDGAVADAIVDTLDRLDADARVRAVVLTGHGATFSAGADLGDGPGSIRDGIAADGGGLPGYQEPAGRVTAAIARLGVPSSPP